MVSLATLPPRRHGACGLQVCGVCIVAALVACVATGCNWPIGMKLFGYVVTETFIDQDGHEFAPATGYVDVFGNEGVSLGDQPLE